MRLRVLICVAFVVRLWHRASWRRAYLHFQRASIRTLVAAGEDRGVAANEVIQSCLIEKAVHLARIPRRPWLLGREELETGSDDGF